MSGKCGGQVLGEVDFGEEVTFEPQVHVLAEGKRFCEAAWLFFNIVQSMSEMLKMFKAIVCAILFTFGQKHRVRKSWEAMESAASKAVFSHHLSDSAAKVAKVFPTAALNKAKEDGPESIVHLLSDSSATRAIERVLELQSAYAVLPNAVQEQAGELQSLVQRTSDFKTVLSQHMAGICGHIKQNLEMKVLLGKDSPSFAIDLSQFVPIFLTMCSKLQAFAVGCAVSFSSRHLATLLYLLWT